MSFKIEPNKARHQEIIHKVCKAHNVKSLELTTRHVEIMDDCITEKENQIKTLILASVALVTDLEDRGFTADDIPFINEVRAALGLPLHKKKK